MGGARILALVAGLMLVPAGPAQAQSDPLSGLPVPVIDVTTTDSNLSDARQEVAVLLDPGGAAPVVRKLRTRSKAEAVRLVAALDQRPGVLATTNSVLRAADLATEPRGAEQYALPMIAAPQAWPSTIGTGVTVAILDTGVQADNPELAGRVLADLNPPADVPLGTDPNGHGTQVASIIGAAHNGVGIAGVAPGVSILPVSALDAMGYGDVATVARAIVIAADAGARVINMSLGGPEHDAVLDAACQYAHAKGVLLVAAAGNARHEGNEAQYPAASPDVIAVSSVGADNQVSKFSNTGSYVDIAAPGERILGSGPTGEISALNGTSAATPHVTGALALLAAANPTLSADQLTDALLTSAIDDISGDGRDRAYGSGTLRIDQALARVLTQPGIAAPVTQGRRVDSMAALPNNPRKGVALTLIAKVSALYGDGTWAADPGGTQVIFEFRATGRKSFKKAGVATVNPGGYAAMNLPSGRTGKWRARVVVPDGTQSVTAAQLVKVRT